MRESYNYLKNCTAQATVHSFCTISTGTSRSLAACNVYVYLILFSDTFWTGKARCIVKNGITPTETPFSPKHHSHRARIFIKHTIPSNETMPADDHLKFIMTGPRTALGAKLEDAKLEAAINAVSSTSGKYPASGSVASALVYNWVDITIKDGGKHFHGTAGGFSSPGGGALIGDVCTDDLEALYAHTDSFMFAAGPGATAVIFFDEHHKVPSRPVRCLLYSGLVAAKARGLDHISKGLIWRVALGFLGNLDMYTVQTCATPG